jgi:hypothetical protein
MTSQRQVIANRRNAAKSTGPKTVVGKAISARNSTTHGFYSTTVLLPAEDREEYLRFARRLAHAYSPCGVLEEEAVRTIIEVRWQMRRANVVDTEMFQIFGFYEGEDRGVGTAFAHDAAQANAFSKLIRYHGFLLRRLQAAEKELARLKESTSDHPAKPATELIAGPEPGQLLAQMVNPPGAPPTELPEASSGSTEPCSK